MLQVQQRLPVLETSRIYCRGGSYLGNRIAPWRSVHSLNVRQNYAVTENKGLAPEGGVTLVLIIGDERLLVQCRLCQAATVGVTVVRDANSAKGGFSVTSGRSS